VGDLDSSGLLDLACDVARRAGDLLVSGRPKVLDVDTKTGPTDVVTDMDHAAERLIVEALSAARPADGVLGEEGSHVAGSSGLEWVVDPIDGTVNYLYDLPGWAVSVAAQRDGRTVVGVVHVPSQGETFTAVLGEGAKRNGEPIHCGRGPRLSRALVATGFGYDAHRRASQGEVLRRLLPRIRDIRRLGACAVDLCAVACGRADAYYERGVKLWDYAAGVLIAEEAGVRVGGIGGAPPSAELLVAAPPGLFEELHDVLAELRADHDLPRPAR
jgi:myo-inositol-1(or 4)-monophosphatase